MNIVHTQVHMQTFTAQAVLFIACMVTSQQVSRNLPKLCTPCDVRLCTRLMYIDTHVTVASREPCLLIHQCGCGLSNFRLISVQPVEPETALQVQIVILPASLCRCSSLLDHSSCYKFVPQVCDPDNV